MILIYNSCYKGFKWFISTDTEKLYAKLAKTNYWKKIIYVNESLGRIGHVENDSSAYIRTILDIELLSKCNEIIMTGGSTFGI